MFGMPQMSLTRRDFLTLGLGAAAAVPLTPVPWKLLDDTSKWTQNWSWIPRPPRGERTVRYTSCTLCPSGCGMQVRCVGRNLIGIAPLPGHPVSQGVLCPYAFGAHQLPYHSARLTEPLHNGTPTSLDKAAGAIARRVDSGNFAILDERPGRAVSAAYQKIATARGGVYIVAGRSESATLDRIAANAGLNPADLGLDLESVRILVSFGAPILESWATPGRVLTLWKQKRLEIIQVEPDLSKTAALANQWIPAETLSDLAAIRSRGPILAVSAGQLIESDEQAVAALNEGSPGIVRRHAPPAIPAARLGSVPDHSLAVLFIDHGPLGGSLPIDALRPKLKQDGIIVSLSPYRAGVAALADYVIPSVAFAEHLDEAPTPWDAALPSYSLAPALLDPPPGVVHPLAFVNRATGADTEPQAAIRARLDAIFAQKRGQVFTYADRAKKPVAGFKSKDDFAKAFTIGACWIDEAAKPITLTKLAKVLAPASPEPRSQSPAITPPLFNGGRA
jgi:anaerobic selenocysteine-containing dehydrogenase